MMITTAADKCKEVRRTRHVFSTFARLCRQRSARYRFPKIADNARRAAFIFFYPLLFFFFIRSPLRYVIIISPFSRPHFRRTVGAGDFFHVHPIARKLRQRKRHRSRRPRCRRRRRDKWNAPLYLTFCVGYRRPEANTGHLQRHPSPRRHSAGGHQVCVPGRDG